MCRKTRTYWTSLSFKWKTCFNNGRVIPKHQCLTEVLPENDVSSNLTRRSKWIALGTPLNNIHIKRVYMLPLFFRSPLWSSIARAIDFLRNSCRSHMLSLSERLLFTREGIGVGVFTRNTAIRSSENQTDSVESRIKYTLRFYLCRSWSLLESEA